MTTPSNPSPNSWEAIAGGPSFKVRCGDCLYFVRDGKCRYLASEAARVPGRPFEHAPFWVWSDCYSDREQVRSDVMTLCPTFEPLPPPPGQSK